MLLTMERDTTCTSILLVLVGESDTQYTSKVQVVESDTPVCL
jgi:hypothetical protein